MLAAVALFGVLNLSPTAHLSRHSLIDDHGSVVLDAGLTLYHNGQIVNAPGSSQVLYPGDILRADGTAGEHPIYLPDNSVAYLQPNSRFHVLRDGTSEDYYMDYGMMRHWFGVVLIRPIQYRMRAKSARAGSSLGTEGFRRTDPYSETNFTVSYDPANHISTFVCLPGSRAIGVHSLNGTDYLQQDNDEPLKLNDQGNIIVGLRLKHDERRSRRRHRRHR